MNAVSSRVRRAVRPAPDRNSGSTIFDITAGADGRAYVTGSLTFATARRAREEGLEKFRGLHLALLRGRLQWHYRFG